MLMFILCQLQIVQSKPTTYDLLVKDYCSCTFSKSNIQPERM